MSCFSAGNSLENTLLPDSNIDDTFNVEALLTINATNAIGAYFCFVIIVLYVISGLILEAKDKKKIKEFLLQNNSFFQTTKEIKLFNSNCSIELKNNSMEVKEKKDSEIEQVKTAEVWDNRLDPDENQSFIDNQEHKASVEEENKYLENKTIFIINSQIRIKKKTNFLRIKLFLS